MKYLFLFTHQTWPMHFYQAGIMARALLNEGHEILWLNCERTMLGCHVHWILPKVSAELICNNCVERGGWLASMGIKSTSLGEFLEAKDHALAQRIQMKRNLKELADWQDGGCPIGKLATSSPASASRTLTLDDPAPELFESMPKAVASALLVHRALERVFEDNPIDRIVLHLGRLVPEQIAQYHAKRLEIPWFCYETGPLLNSMRVVRNGTIYDKNFYRETWNDFSEIPLTLEQSNQARSYLQLRRGDQRKTGMFNYSPIPTSARKLLTQLGVSPGQKLISFFTSSQDEIATIGSATDPSWVPVYTSQLAAIGEAVEWVRQRPDWSLVIRIHPNEAAERNHLGMAGRKSLEAFDAFTAKIGLPPNVRVVRPEESISSYTLMEVSRVGLAWLSTAGLEMATMGRPVVALDNPSYRTAGFTWNPRAAGQLETVISDALSAGRDELVARAARAVRWVYHQDIRRSIDFPLIKDHGRMERVSLTFSDPGSLRRGHWRSLDKILDFLQFDRSPYQTDAISHDGDARNERACIERLLASQDQFALEGPALTLPPRIENASELRGAFAGIGLPVLGAAELWDDIGRVLRLAKSESPVIVLGPLGYLMPIAARNHRIIHVDHARPDIIDAPIAGPATAIPFRPRCAGAVIIHGLAGSDPALEIQAARAWLQPGGLLLLIDLPGAVDTQMRFTQSSLTVLLERMAMKDVLVRATEGGHIALATALGSAPKARSPREAADALSEVLQPVQQGTDRMLSPDGRHVRMVRVGRSWSAWPQHLAACQPAADGDQGDDAELLELVPPGVRSVLLVECGSGAMGLALKRARPLAEIHGSESRLDLARGSDAVLDRVYIAAPASLAAQLEDGFYDAIVLSSTLANSADLDSLLGALQPKLSRHGSIIAAFHNTLRAPLLRSLFEGGSEKTPGPEARAATETVRTRASIVQMLHKLGFKIESMTGNSPVSPLPEGLVQAVGAVGWNTTNLVEDSGSSRYLVVASPAADAEHASGAPEFDEAFQAYKQAISCAPDESPARVAATLARALELAPADVPWRMDLVARLLFVLKKMGQHQFAAALAKQEEGNCSDSPDFFFALGDVLLDWTASAPEMVPSLLSEAESAWRRCLVLGERPAVIGAVRGRGSHLAAHNLALVLEGTGRPEEAVHLRSRYSLGQSGLFQ